MKRHRETILPPKGPAPAPAPKGRVAATNTSQQGKSSQAAFISIAHLKQHELTKVLYKT